MKKLYFFIIFLTAFYNLFGQDEVKTKKEKIPLFQNSPDGISESNLIPIQQGSKFTLQVNYIAPAKKSFIKKLLKVTGIGIATYQSEKLVEQKSGKYSAGSTNNNWLLPLGVGMTVSTDRLIANKRSKTFLNYSLYDQGMQLISSSIIPVKKRKRTFCYSRRINSRWLS